MLSRIADSLFWMSRYMARAEDTARLLDVTYHMLLEQTQDSYQLRWDGIITITGEQDLFYCFTTKQQRRMCSSSSLFGKTTATRLSLV